ncbi:hypothetical protein [Actinoplanes flavus]|uniref:Uncharacterized protein n=1 Tax=Actinoplanes flavus TaxID=2820290 RepID=A0ABS3UT59_9ACTN|nr:hypothetical protein [Actinoplanes flavus]MBO3741741.1 hypothetical protein [Actinoplanes flavus]
MHDYLQQMELLAVDVVAAAQDEGRQTYGDDSAGATPLQRSVNELVRVLRHHHFEGGGCVEPNRPVLHLGGAALFAPVKRRADRTGLLDNWAPGRDLHPVQPRRGQIRAVVRGRVGPIILSPSHASTRGLGGC